MCSVPSMWRRISATARVGVALSQQRDELAVLVVRARQDLLGVGDLGDQVAHLPLDLGHLGDQVRRVRGLRDADVKADVRAAVLLEARRLRHPLDELRRARRNRRRSARSLARTTAPSSTATRWSRTARASRPSGSTSLSVERRALGDEGAAGAAADRAQVARLDQRRQRLAQRRARDPELLGERRARAAACFPARGARPGSRCRAARPSPRTSVGARTGCEHRFDRYVPHAIYRNAATARPNRARAPRGSRRSPARCRRKWTALMPSSRAPRRC